MSCLFLEYFFIPLFEASLGGGIMNTAAVSLAVTPTVVSTFLSHVSLRLLFSWFLIVPRTVYHAILKQPKIHSSVKTWGIFSIDYLCVTPSSTLIANRFDNALQPIFHTTRASNSSGLFSPTLPTTQSRSSRLLQASGFPIRNGSRSKKS